MEKLDLQIFRNLKKEIIEYLKNYNKAEESGEIISEEEEQKFLTRYKEIIEILSKHDLSDIDFEEWRGMYLYSSEEIPIDFSKTNANIDFSIVEYNTYKTFQNFQSCKIKNFDFDKYYYPDMFDEEFRKENEDRFLSKNISEEVADRFYKGELTLTDIKNNLELVNKIEEKNVEPGLRKIYKAIGKEEFCKLDAQFVDTTKYVSEKLINSNSQLKTAEEIMTVLYKFAREKIIGYPNDEANNRFYYTQNQLGDKFRKMNPDLFLSEESPASLREHYYEHHLSIKEFSENLKYFEGKVIAHSFRDYDSDGMKIVNLYGDDIYQLFVNYKPIIDRLLNDYTAMQTIEVPTGPITEEQRKEIMSTALTTYITRNGFEQVQNWDEFKMILDFIPMEYLPATPTTRKFIKKYGIDKIIESGLDIKYLFKDQKLTSIEEIASLNGIELKDIKKLVDRDSKRLLDSYDVKQLLEYGIKDLSELSETYNDLHQVKEMLEKRPLDLINMGRFQDIKKEFIEKYGIDNIIALDEETSGMFSHQLGENDIYLTMLAEAERRAPKLEGDEQLTYEQFRYRMYEILLHAREERGLLTGYYYEDYDFIQGKFREEYQDIFLDGEILENIKRAFYTRHMTAEMVRKNPELIQLLQGKDLSRAFPQKMIAGMSMQMLDTAGNAIGGIPNNVNMAQYLSENIGQGEFLKICSEYGKCLDNITLFIKDENSIKNLREVIEQSIYRGIKENGIEYFEDLPLSFREKHPELFLPKEIDEDLRKKFYEGNLTFSDIRRNPKIKELLLTKDISVGFSKIKMLQMVSGEKIIHPLWKEFTEKEIMDLAEEYGDYLRNVNANFVVNGQSNQEKIKSLEIEIEQNILNRKSMYTPNVPRFFKQLHPDMFLDENAPNELKGIFYDSAGIMEHIIQGGIYFQLIKDNPEWKEFLEGKDLSRAFTEEYSELFKRFDNKSIMKLGTRNPEIIEKMVLNHKEDVLQNWYRSTGGKFVPHHVVMLNFPEGEIDSFLGNSKKWSQLMRIDNYNLNDDGKAAILKVSYVMGVFQGENDGFNKTMKLFTDVPQELTQEEYEKVTSMFSGAFDPFRWSGSNFDPEQKDKEMKSLFEQAYTLNDEGKYVLSIDKQKNKDSVRMVREILERSQIPRILTPEKAHQMFDSFTMEYNPEFVKFFNDNIEEIISNPEYIKDIATIQRQFKDIVRTNAGRRLTLDVAQDYIKSIVYTDIEVGNEGLAEQAKIAGYSQKDFEAIQDLFNEGETRDFSSIPRIQGTTKGYTYEMLRCDDPLALTIGTLTDCCQEIHGAGQTSMEHSVVSPDGRVFCVRDAEGRLVAQSWFWRNQYTGCFDNIEIPSKIFELYEKEHPDVGRKGLTTDVLEVYKKAAQDLMKEDARIYQELLDNKTITREQYDALLLGKVTIGLGYNDIADAIKADNTIHQETDIVSVKGTSRLPHPYTDASTQYTIAERDGTIKSEHKNLYVHQDDVPVYDGTNMSTTVLFKMKRMEEGTGRDNLAYLRERNDKENLSKSQRIINSIAREYGMNPNDTRVMATSRIAIIYSKDKDNKIIIGDLFSSPLKKELNEEQKQKATAHIMYQVKKALKQIGIQDSKVDLSLLSEEQHNIIQTVMKEIEKENNERGEKLYG